MCCYFCIVKYSVLKDFSNTTQNVITLYAPQSHVFIPYYVAKITAPQPPLSAGYSDTNVTRFFVYLYNLIHAGQYHALT